jgi:hypothetical protein
MMFHGPVSRWLMIASGASLANGQECQAAPAGGVKAAVASCRPRSRQPTPKTPSSLHACGLTDSPGMYVTTSSALALTGRGLPANPARSR